MPCTAIQDDDALSEGGQELDVVFASDEPIAAAPGRLALAAGRDPLRWDPLLAAFGRVAAIGRAGSEPPFPAPAEPGAALPALAVPGLS